MWICVPSRISSFWHLQLHAGFQFERWKLRGGFYKRRDLPMFETHSLSLGPWPLRFENRVGNDAPRGLSAERKGPDGKQGCLERSFQAYAKRFAHKKEICSGTLAEGSPSVYLLEPILVTQPQLFAYFSGIKRTPYISVLYQSIGPNFLRQERSGAKLQQSKPLFSRRTFWPKSRRHGETLHDCSRHDRQRRSEGYCVWSPYPFCLCCQKTHRKADSSKTWQRNRSESKTCVRKNLAAKEKTILAEGHCFLGGYRSQRRTRALSERKKRNSFAREAAFWQSNWCSSKRLSLGRGWRDTALRQSCSQKKKIGAARCQKNRQIGCLQCALEKHYRAPGVELEVFGSPKGLVSRPCVAKHLQTSCSLGGLVDLHDWFRNVLSCFESLLLLNHLSCILLPGPSGSEGFHLRTNNLWQSLRPGRGMWWVHHLQKPCRRKIRVQAAISGAEVCRAEGLPRRNSLLWSIQIATPRLYASA